MSNTQGFTEAARRMRNRSKYLRGEYRTLWTEQSRNVQNAIVDNTDASYHGSEALTMAVNSAQNWQHTPDLHTLNIMSTLFANYRQYGCGGLPITPLIRFTESDLQTMTDRFGRLLHEAR